MIGSCDPDQPVPDPPKIESPPVQCRSVRPDTDGFCHSSCEPVGVSVQNFDIVNADFVFRSVSIDVLRYPRV